ncbi:TetR family transcriptional regulator [Amycolatopsis carbonis]|uniref:TetR family transcriptional regulator n=1 Tax=Amycolatopsis carbonis TaxID=715471 RepID=A0A9Y2ID23_9PSEU|nr:TetR/AcrR family transcriptional regulator [Amycolatopsis sp. 2-15]WIX77507.1 TetR family transcriptional regulator [Amycolatopsis sp. 2-15]
MPATPGRRERKKARTRQALDEAALRLFLAHGYDHVTVARIAEEADVSVATLFAHVPDGKEALIFDDGTERREGLVAAVREREAGEPVLTALRRFFASRGPFAAELPPEYERKRALIVTTPALRGYARKLWIASEDALTDAIADASDLPATDMAARALARYVLEIPDLTGTEPDPLAALNVVFDLLEAGWPQRPA